MRLAFAILMGTFTLVVPASTISDSYAYVSLSGATPGAIAAFNIATNKFGPTIPLATIAVGAARAPGGGEIWVVTANQFGSGTNSIVVVDGATGQTLATIPVAFQPSGGIVFNARGTFAYVMGTTSQYGQPLITNLAVVSVARRTMVAQSTPKVIQLYGGLALSASNSTLYVAQGGSIATIDAETLVATGTIPLPPVTGGNAIIAMAGTYLLADYSGTLSVIDTSTNTIINTLPLPPVTSIAVAPGGATAYLCTPVFDQPSSTIQTLGIPSLQVTNTQSYTVNLSLSAVSPDGKRLAAGSFPLVVIDTASLAITNQVYGIEGSAVALFGPSSSSLYAIFGSPSAISVIDQTTGTQVSQIAVGNGAGSVASNFSYHLIFVATGPGVSIIDPDTQQVVGTIPLGNPTGNVYYGVLAVAGDQVYVAYYKPISYNLATGLTTVLPVPRAGPALTVGYGELVVSPDNRSLYVSFYAGYPLGGEPSEQSMRPGITNTPFSAVAIYDTAANALVAQPMIPGAGAVAFSPDSSLAYVTGAVNGLAGVYVIDNQTRTIQSSWAFPAIGGIQYACISPDGATLYVLDFTDATHVYAIDTTTFQIKQTFPIPTAYLPSNMAISPDGTTLFLSGDNGPFGYLGYDVVIMNSATGSTSVVPVFPQTVGVATANGGPPGAIINKP